MHVRQPRPPLLAINDRPRASSHEPLHSLIAGTQSVVVHGPRVARPGASSIPTGLDRAPRSRWAVRVALVDPPESIIPLGWGGAITLRAQASFGSWPDGAEGWQVGSAELVVGSTRLKSTEPSSFALGTTGGDVALSWPEASGAVALLRSLPPATPIMLELVLKCELRQEESAENFLLRRQVRFALLAGGSASGAVEKSVFARFDDPEFNDRLSGLAQIARITSPLNPDNEVVLAADLSKLVAGEQIEGVIAIRPIQDGGPVTPRLTPKDGVLHYGDAPLQLAIERVRRGDKTSFPLIAEDGTTPVIGAICKDDVFELEGSAETSVASFTVRTALLTVGRDGAGPPLLAGDRIVMRVFRKGVNAQSVLLSVDIVAPGTGAESVDLRTARAR